MPRKSCKFTREAPWPELLQAVRELHSASLQKGGSEQLLPVVLQAFQSFFRAQWIAFQRISNDTPGKAWLLRGPSDLGTGPGLDPFLRALEKSGKESFLGGASPYPEALQDALKGMPPTGGKQAACVRLALGDEDLGVLALGGAPRQSWSKETWGQAVQLFAEQTAVAIRNADRFEEAAQQPPSPPDRAETAEAAAPADAPGPSPARSLPSPEGFEEIVGGSEPMQKIYRLLLKLDAVEETILIVGESGTGKELVARAIHNRSRRASKPFVVENCAALTETLLESELFGHKKGSFTGAVADRKGLLEIADNGTLFLDEIGEVSPGMQKKLLRVLQDGEIRPVGGRTVKHVNVRLLTATNSDLEQAVKEGLFREDLYYRINVIQVLLPALRERREDIPMLVEHLLARICREMNQPPVTVSEELMQDYCQRDWPGNVRELENELRRLVALGQTGLRPRA